MSSVFSLLLTAVFASFSPFYSTELPPKAEILIVSGTDNAQDAQTLLRTFTYLKRTAAIASPEAASSALSNYEAIVCLDPAGASPVFMERLASSDKPLFLIGRDFSRAYLEYTGYLGEMVTGAAAWQYGGKGFPMQSGVTALDDTPVLSSPAYHAGSLRAGSRELPLFAGSGSLRLLPLPISSSLLPALVRELSLWLWPYADTPPDYAAYLVLDNIYPFVEPKRLLDAIDLCIDAGIPFVLAVQPFYHNGDYPAMRHFCELLAYAQANGGSILLRAPLWQGSTPSLPTLQESFTKALTLYTANGVYPLGVAVPAYWQEDARLRQALARFRTVLLLEDSSEVPVLTENRNAILDDGHRLLVQAPSVTGLLSMYPTALCLDLNTLTDDALTEALHTVKSSGIPLGSLWSMDHAVYADNLTLLYDGAVLSLNGERKALTYTPAPVEEPYDYRRGMLARVTMSLAGGSKLALLLTIFALAVFLVFMLIGRRQGRQSFFHWKGSDDDTS